MRLFDFFKKDSKTEITADEDCGITVPSKDDIAFEGTCGNGFRWVMDKANTLVISGVGPLDAFLKEETFEVTEQECEINAIFGNYLLLVGDEETYIFLDWGHPGFVSKVIIQQGITALCQGIFGPQPYYHYGLTLYSNYSCLTDIILPDTIESITGVLASDCPSLEKVVIPNSVTQISPQAFVDCPKLTIYTTAGSFAETFARSNNIPVQLVHNMAEYKKLTTQKWPSKENNA